MKYDEYFQSKYGCKGYVLDDLKRVRPGPDSKVVDFGLLWKVLKSNDEELLKQNEWIFDNDDAKYLDVASQETVESTGNLVAYCSFPRCGNSFLRKYFQMISGIATGADMSLEFSLDLQL